MEDASGVGPVCGLEGREPVHDFVDLVPVVGALEALTDGGVEDVHRDRVALAEDKVGEARGKDLRVVDLCEFAGAVFHRFAPVDDEVGDEVRVLLVLLDVVAVCAAEDLPIQMAEIVAGGVFAVLGKFDGKSVERRAVLANAVTLHDSARDHAKSLTLGDRIRIEQILSPVGHGV